MAVNVEDDAVLWSTYIVGAPSAQTLSSPVIQAYVLIGMTAKAVRSTDTVLYVV